MGRVEKSWHCWPWRRRNRCVGGEDAEDEQAQGDQPEGQGDGENRDQHEGGTGGVVGVVQVRRAERFLAQAVAAQQGCGFYWTWWGGVWGKLERHLVCCALLMDVLNRFHVDLFGWWL